MEHIMRRIILFIPTILFLLSTLVSIRLAGAFDQQHIIWDRLLQKHVIWIANGTASQVDYTGFQQDRQSLNRYLESLSALSRSEFEQWNRQQRLAFLINAYNAFTIERILSKYPELKSIKDLGSLFKSPWKQKFFTLFGEQRHLDYIEHELIRAPGVYDEPRIHIALVCASIGCPALRDEAYTADQLDAQLEDGMRRFFSDRSRNRYNPDSGKLEVSKIFDWYTDDFSAGHAGFNSLQSVFARYADLLTNDPQNRRYIRNGEVEIFYLDYDWALNDRGP
jgi:hypothetical protein